MRSGRWLLALAVLGAPLAWIAQLVLGYAFEQTACSPGDGHAVWGIDVRALHVVVGAGALGLAAAALVAALGIEASDRSFSLDLVDRRFLVSFAVVGSLVFAFAIVLTGVGSTVLTTCHSG